MIDTREYLLLPCPPMSKASENRIVRNKKTGATYMAKSPEYQEWSKLVTAWLRGKYKRPLQGSLRFDYVLIMPDLIRRDLDNAVSGLMDAASGVVYADDSQIAEIHGLKLLERPEKGAPKECRLYFLFTQAGELTQRRPQ